MINGSSQVFSSCATHVKRGRWARLRDGMDAGRLVAPTIVANPGILDPDRIEELSDERLIRTVDANLLHPFAFVQAAADASRGQRRFGDPDG
jgi:NAD(P)-dependent dehydrogenase (short-subunit alcohol dehydrogenase family)